MRPLVPASGFASLVLGGILGICPAGALSSDLPPGSRALAPLPDGAKPAAAATLTKDPIRLDGTLDEPAWQTADPIGRLLQREPREGEPASEETDVRVLFTLDALYIGVVCHDRTPSGIVSTRLTRDAELGVDDNVFVIVDPFLDHRNGFFFQVNPAGARSDGQVSNNAEEHRAGLGRHLGRRGADHGDGLERRDRDPVQDAALQPRPDGVGFQRRAAASSA